MAKARSSRLVTVLGALGYFAILLQWVWLVMLCVPILLTVQPLKPVESTPPPVVVEPIPWVSAAIAAVTVVAVMGLTIYIVAKLPGYVVKESSQIVHGARDMVLPKVLPPQKISRRKKIQLSSRVLFVLKLLLVIAPFVGLFGATAMSPPLSPDIIWTVGLFLMSWSLVYVIAQRVVAHIRAVDYSLSV